MKLILLVIMLTTFLSCGENEVKPFENYQYRTVLKKVLVGDEEFISIKDSICEKRKYRIWLDKVGALEKFHTAPIEECFLLFGYQVRPTSELAVLLEYARKEIAAHAESLYPEEYEDLISKSELTEVKAGL